MIENLLAVLPERALASFYRTSAGAEIDLVVEFPGMSQTWAVEIKRSLSVRPTRGFFLACETVCPDKSFVVHAGDECHEVSEGLEAVSVSEMVQMFRQAGSHFQQD